MTAGFCNDFIDFDPRRKVKGFLRCLSKFSKKDVSLIVIEGTGIAVGAAAIICRLFIGRNYVLSSGDAVSPFLSARFPIGSPLFILYEWALCRFSVGFIGWTPYLVGRALTLGARRAVTIPGWAPFHISPAELAERRRQIRFEFGIPEDALLYGIVGSLRWSNRYHYCYGMELISAAKRSGGKVYILIVGDGSGAEALKALAGEDLGKTIFLPGRIARNEVPGYLAAMDIGSLPQSVDKVGSFRYSTKISEYREAGLPFITNEIPMAYDLDNGDIWRLPGDSPWSETFIASLAALMGRLTRAELAACNAKIIASYEFEKARQIERATTFLCDIIDNMKPAIRARRPASF